MFFQELALFWTLCFFCNMILLLSLRIERSHYFAFSKAKTISNNLKASRLIHYVSESLYLILRKSVLDFPRVRNDLKKATHYNDCLFES